MFVRKVALEVSFHDCSLIFVFLLKMGDCSHLVLTSNRLATGTERELRWLIDRWIANHLRVRRLWRVLEIVYDD